MAEATYVPVPPLTSPQTAFMVSGKVYTYVPPGVSFVAYTPYNYLTPATLCPDCGEFNQIQSVAEYDWGLGGYGNLIQTTTGYKWQDPTPSGSSTVGAQYLAAGLIDLPMYVLVAGPTNLEETDYYYDEPSSPPVSSGVTTQFANIYASPIRGHLTSVARATNNGAGRNGFSPPNPGELVTRTHWYDTGVPYQTVDAIGNTTTHSYANAYAGAYVTGTVDPLGNGVSATYDYNTGLMTGFTGVNSATTTYTYDALHRPIRITYPDGAQHTNTYNVTPPAGQGNVVVQDSIDISRSDVHTLIYDGFGRELHSQHNSDASGITYADTTYDANGHASIVSNPYRAKSDTTYGVTTTTYDALGR